MTGVRWLSRLGMNTKLALALIVLSGLIGIGAALGGSALSLTTAKTTAGPRPEVSPTPSARPSPKPSGRPAPTASGALGAAPRLELAGGALLASKGDAAWISTDEGASWSQLRAPSGTSGILVDRGTRAVAVAGGRSVRFTTNAGGSWAAPRVSPPPGGTYVPLAASPWDATVWFFNHDGRLLRTRDGGNSWKELQGLPALGSGLMTAGTAADQFFLAAEGHVFQLDNNGEKIDDRGSLSGGLTVAALVVVSASGDLLARASDGRAYVGKGTTWQATAAPSGGPLAAVPDQMVLAADGGGRLGSPAVVSQSADQGVTWKAASGLPADQSIEALVAAPPGSKSFAYGYGGDLYVSTDGGLTWSFASDALRTK